MPHFIKTGYWEKAVKNYKGWLDLEQLIASVSPGGNPGLQAVLNAQNYANDVGQNLYGATFLNVIGNRNNILPAFPLANYQHSYNFSQNNYFSTNAPISTGSFTTAFYATNAVVDLDFSSLETNTNKIFFYASDNSQLNVNYNAGEIFSVISSQVEAGTNSSGANLINIDDIANLHIKSDSCLVEPGSSISFDSSRYGIKIDSIASVSATYNDIPWGIYDDSNRIYFGGKLYVNTLVNPALSATSATFGNPINYQNSTTSSAGSSSGEYLTVYINGVQRKIALLNP